MRTREDRFTVTKYSRAEQSRSLQARPRPPRANLATTFGKKAGNPRGDSCWRPSEALAVFVLFSFYTESSKSH